MVQVISPESPAKLYCCYGVITVLTVAVVALSVALSVRKTEQIASTNIYAVCPRDWIGFGNKCFYFYETPSNWTSCQNLCMAQGAHLARFDNLEDLNFLRRYKGDFNYWMGLHRESSAHPWRWTDNTEYNNMFPIRGDEKYGFLSENGISSSSVNIQMMCVCSKPMDTLPCQ